VKTRGVRIGVDTGGTFTDLTLDPGKGKPLIAYKLLSTPDDPARAVLLGLSAILQKFGEAESSGFTVVHGSTVATNALLEGKGAKAALVTTKGFEDTLWIGRQNRPELYALEPVKPEPPIAREAALGADERVLHDGSVLKPIQHDEIECIVGRIHELGVESVAISFLHSYVNGEHERMLARALAKALPELHLTVSHELLPEFREYERAATCVVNAVVAPPMVSYLKRLDDNVGNGRLRIMASAGGSLPLEAVNRAPVSTILSGPAGGVVGALAVSQAAGVDRIITFDMGGTSTDVSLCDGDISRTSESEIGGLPLRLPMIDLRTVGAGGGSVAWLDEGGALRVGPQSMGADPGPACYGRQTEPFIATVTDAHLVLGHLSVKHALGDDLALDADAARSAVRDIADATDLGIEETALGILRVAEATMARAIRRISVERGYDPRDFALVSFGGAGGLHAARLAELIGIGTVFVPGEPGLLSAVGMLRAAPLHTFSQGVMLRVPPDEARKGALLRHYAIRRTLDELQAKADDALRSEGIPEDERVYSPSLDVRYVGQSYELTIPLDEGDPAKAFALQHQRLYGYTAPEKPLEVVTVRLQAGGAEHLLPLPRLPERRGPIPVELVEAASVWTDGQQTVCARIRRDELMFGDSLDGPAIIDEYSATTLVPHGWRFEVNALGQLLLSKPEDSEVYP